MSGNHAPGPYDRGHMSADTIISGQGVVKRWGSTTALDGASFTVQRGVTGLLGANGAGKTTLLGMLLGLHRPDEGALQVFGLDPMTAGAAVRERLGYSPEHHVLPSDVQAFDLVRHIAELHGLPRRDATNRASDALYAVGLGEERFRPIGTMSTGQRQRVKLAQALVHDPELVLLDEPTNGLDPIQRDDMLALVRRIGTDLGFTVLISSHLLGEVEQVSDNIIMLEGGKVARSGSIANLLGGEMPLVVEVVEGAKRLADHLANKGFAAVAKDDLRLAVPAGKNGIEDAVVAAVVDLDLELRRMEHGQATLGELFDLEEASAR